MANGLKSLSEIFHNRIFRIPDYQRGYAWKNEQLTDFWEDLLNLHESRYHYTGLLSLKEVHRQEGLEEEWLLKNGYKLFHIVDGQQRLTTFSILMHEIISLVERVAEEKTKRGEDIFLGDESLKDIKKKYILRRRPPQNIITTYLFGYEVDNPSSNYLKYRVYDEPSGGSIVETYYTKNLKHAKGFFAENLKVTYESEGISGIEQVYKKLTLRLMFNLHEIEDDYDVFVAFETMNNRGKKLTNLELLKNRLIYLTTLFNDRQADDRDKNELRKKINDTWKEVYYQLGRNQDAPLSDDDFLRAHWIMYYRYSRKGGDDYIRFLLNKYSAKNVFEKTATVTRSEEETDSLPSFESSEDYDNDSNVVESETVPTSSLDLKEISDYINSLKDLAEYWYISFHPTESRDLTDEEKVWIDRINRIGIGYFRPLVVAALSRVRQTTVEERTALLRAIERFIFLSFRIAGFNASYKSTDYLRNARDLQRGDIKITTIIEDLTRTVDENMKVAIESFIVRTSRRFDSGEGFYSWRNLPYFLYEYEYELSCRHNLTKVNWHLFTKVEKDRVTIEHILPQTPSKLYWRNQFRQYSEEETKQLSASLGNLLPLAQSINSSLQNDSFLEKKNPSSLGRRGYVNGSHSEIEVASENDWDAIRILKRGLSLLDFMRSRWELVIDEEQKRELLHIQFVSDERPESPEIIEEELLQADDLTQSTSTQVRPSLDNFWYDFWSCFVEYCRTQGRSKDIGAGKPPHGYWYDVSIGSPYYHLFFKILQRGSLRIGIYVYNSEDFTRLETLRNEIEEAYGASLEWNGSRKKSKAKSILHSIDADIRNHELYPQHFNWFINQFDKLRAALQKVDIANNSQTTEHFNTMVITEEMTVIAYEVSKRVFEGSIGQNEGKHEIVRRTGMNASSAGDYIVNFIAIVNGDKYTRTLNEYSTRYYLNHIRQDYGETVFQKAIDACRKHATYYAALGCGRLTYVERIIGELTGDSILDDR